VPSSFLLGNGLPYGVLANGGWGLGRGSWSVTADSYLDSDGFRRFLERSSAGAAEASSVRLDATAGRTRAHR